MRRHLVSPVEELTALDSAMMLDLRVLRISAEYNQDVAR
jgi:hypothetical protein